MEITYGRIVMKVPAHKTKKLKNAAAGVSFWVNDKREPYYIYGSTAHLEYMLGDTLHKIYNPQKFKFDIQVFQNYLVLLHRYTEGIVPRDFKVVSD